MSVSNQTYGQGSGRNMAEAREAAAGMALNRIATRGG